eukprot:3772424-Alexandrium_andersonii.AAC.1
MSASLVGSEMCIRDSQAKRRDARPTCQQQCIRWRVELTALRACPQSCICLLYTSDAADDM